MSSPSHRLTRAAWSSVLSLSTPLGTQRRRKRRQTDPFVDRSIPLFRSFLLFLHGHLQSGRRKPVITDHSFVFWLFLFSFCLSPRSTNTVDDASFCLAERPVSGWGPCNSSRRRPRSPAGDKERRRRGESLWLKKPAWLCTSILQIHRQGGRSFYRPSSLAEPRQSTHRDF